MRPHEACAAQVKRCKRGFKRSSGAPSKCDHPFGSEFWHDLNGRIQAPASVIGVCLNASPERRWPKEESLESIIERINVTVLARMACRSFELAWWVVDQ